MPTRPQVEQAGDRRNARVVLALLVAIRNAPARKIVRRELHHNLIAGKDADIVHADLARNGAENLMTILELNAKHCVGQGFGNRTLEFDCIFLLHKHIFLSKRQQLSMIQHKRAISAFFVNASQIVAATISL